MCSSDLPLDAFPTLVMASVDADRCDSFCDELCPPPPPLLLLEPPPGAFGLEPLSEGAAVGMILRLPATTGVLVSAEPDAVVEESVGIKNYQGA